MSSDICLTMARVSPILSSEGLLIACRPQQPRIKAVLLNHQPQSPVNTHRSHDLVRVTLRLTVAQGPSELGCIEMYIVCFAVQQMCGKLWIVLGHTLYLAFRCLAWLLFLATGNTYFLTDRMERKCYFNTLFGINP